MLMFITGSTQVPLGGYTDSRPETGGRVGTFSIERIGISDSNDYNENHLPSSHTCVRSISLPAYTTREEMKAKLFLAIQAGYEGFAFA